MKRAALAAWQCGQPPMLTRSRVSIGTNSSGPPMSTAHTARLLTTLPSQARAPLRTPTPLPQPSPHISSQCPHDASTNATPPLPPPLPSLPLPLPATTTRTAARPQAPGPAPTPAPPTAWGRRTAPAALGGSCCGTRARRTAARWTPAVSGRRRSGAGAAGGCGGRRPGAALRPVRRAAAAGWRRAAGRTRPARLQRGTRVDTEEQSGGRTRQQAKVVHRRQQLDAQCLVKLRREVQLLKPCSRRCICALTQPSPPTLNSPHTPKS